MDEEVGIKMSVWMEIQPLLDSCSPMHVNWKTDSLFTTGEGYVLGSGSIIGHPSLQHAKKAEAGLQRRIEYTRLITKFTKNSLKISEP